MHGHPTDSAAGDPGAERSDPKSRDIVLERRLRCTARHKLSMAEPKPCNCCFAKIVLIVLETRLCIAFFSERREGAASGQDFCFLPNANHIYSVLESVHKGIPSQFMQWLLTGVGTPKYASSTPAPEK